MLTIIYFIDFTIFLSKLSLKLFEQIDNRNELAESIITNPPQIILYPFSSSELFYTNSELSKYGLDEYWASHILGYREIGSIFYRINPDNDYLFECFKCFQIDVWIAIFFSIILFAIILSIDNFSIINIIKNLFELTLIFISKSLSKYFKNTIS